MQGGVIVVLMHQCLIMFSVRKNPKEGEEEIAYNVIKVHED